MKNKVNILIKSRSLESNQTKKKKKRKLQTRLYWVCSWEIMKSATSPTPLSIGLSGIQFSILNVLESLIPKEQKKNNNAEMKSGRFLRLHTSLNTHCCEYKKYCKRSIPREQQPNQIKKIKIADTVLIERDVLAIFLHLTLECDLDSWPINIMPCVLHINIDSEHLLI